MAAHVYSWAAFFVGILFDFCFKEINYDCYFKE